MKGYFFDELSYECLVKMAKVHEALSGEHNFSDVLETAIAVDIP